MTAVRDEAVDAAKSLAPTEDEKAALGVLSDIANDIKVLARQEVELAKAEITAEVSKIGKGAGLFVAAALAGLMFLIFASCAAWWGLANIMDEGWAALIVAAVWVLIAIVAALAGRAALKSISLKPERTLESLKRLPDAFSTR
jgi:Putative Actinobacterial Holin-X, holin superfamily III